MIVSGTTNLIDIVRDKYPNAKEVAVCMCKYHCTYYKDDSLSEVVAESYYTNISENSIIGVKLELIIN